MTWGHADLAQLLKDAKAGLSLSHMAIRQGPGVSSSDCDQALWVKLGRTFDEALAVLNGSLGKPKQERAG